MARLRRRFVLDVGDREIHRPAAYSAGLERTDHRRVLNGCGDDMARGKAEASGTAQLSRSSAGMIFAIGVKSAPRQALRPGHEGEGAISLPVGKLVAAPSDEQPHGDDALQARDDVRHCPVPPSHCFQEVSTISGARAVGSSSVSRSRSRKRVRTLPAPAPDGFSPLPDRPCPRKS